MKRLRLVFVSQPMQCPACGGRLTGHAPVGHTDEPDDDALTVCAHCDALLRFHPALGLVVLCGLPDDADPRTKRDLDLARAHAKELREQARLRRN